MGAVGAAKGSKRAPALVVVVAVRELNGDWVLVGASKTATLRVSLPGAAPPTYWTAARSIASAYSGWLSGQGVPFAVKWPFPLPSSSNTYSVILSPFGFDIEVISEEAGIDAFAATDTFCTFTTTRGAVFVGTGWALNGKWPLLLSTHTSTSSASLPSEQPTTSS